MNLHIGKYILRKLAVVVLTLLLVTLLSFLLMRLSPIDPATAYVKRNSAIVSEEQIEQARIQLGMDRPLSSQYLNWVKSALLGDYGISLGTGKPVAEEMAKSIPITMSVVAYCGVFMIIGVLVVGSLGYIWTGKIYGKILSLISIIAISTPPFYFAINLLDTFAVRLGWIQVSGNSGLAKYVPVALCLSFFGIGFYGELLASTLRQEMSQDYILFSRCRGISESRLLLCHALPHAVINLLPSFAQMLGLSLANAAIIERIFSLSGLGYLIVDSVIKRDSPVIHASVLFLALMLVLFDTVANILQQVLRKDANSAVISS